MRTLYSDLSAEEASKITEKISEKDVPYELRNGEVIFLKEGYEHNLERAQIWDPATMAVAYNSAGVVQLTLTEPSIVRNLDALNELYEPDRLTGEYRYLPGKVKRRRNTGGVLSKHCSSAMVKVPTCYWMTVET